MFCYKVYINKLISLFLGGKKTRVYFVFSNLSTLYHLKYLISNDENGCSGSLSTDGRGWTGVPVVCRHGCFAEMSRQPPDTHHGCTQHGKDGARRQKRNVLDISLFTFFLILELFQIRLKTKIPLANSTGYIVKCNVSKMLFETYINMKNPYSASQKCSSKYSSIPSNLVSYQIISEETHQRAD